MKNCYFKMYFLLCVAIFSISANCLAGFSSCPLQSAEYIEVTKKLAELLAQEKTLALEVIAKQAAIVALETSATNTLGITKLGKEIVAARAKSVPLQLERLAVQSRWAMVGRGLVGASCYAGMLVVEEALTYVWIFNSLTGTASAAEIVHLRDVSPSDCEVIRLNIVSLRDNLERTLELEVINAIKFNDGLIAQQTYKDLAARYREEITSLESRISSGEGELAFCVERAMRTVGYRQRDMEDYLEGKTVESTRGYGCEAAYDSEKDELHINCKDKFRVKEQVGGYAIEAPAILD